MTFQLDTTGLVDADEGKYIAIDGQLYLGVGWGILTPFTQGYVEALFASELPDGAQLRGNHIPLGFSNLAPETLARIISDCEAYAAAYPRRDWNAAMGAHFWNDRQAVHFRDHVFPPLTVSLNDAGKVVFA